MIDVVAWLVACVVCLVVGYRAGQRDERRCGRVVVLFGPERDELTELFVDEADHRVRGQA